MDCINNINLKMASTYGVSENWINSSRENSLTGLIRSNLTYAFDFARKQTYPGSGSVVYDLAGSDGVYGTLTNGPSFNSNNLGSISFDGVDDYIALNNAGNNTSSPIALATPSTVYAWVNPTSTTDEGVIGHYSGGPVNVIYGIDAGRIAVYQYWTQWTYYMSTGPTVPTNTWSLLTWVRNSDTVTNVYLNNSLNDTLNADTGNGQYFGGGNIGGIGTRWDGAGRFSGNIAMVLVYNTAHDINQVSQQYSVLRKRYGV